MTDDSWGEIEEEHSAANNFLPHGWENIPQRQLCTRKQTRTTAEGIWCWDTQVTTARKVLSGSHLAVRKAVSWDRRQLVAEICNKEHTA